jgi:hypothetical protein
MDPMDLQCQAAVSQTIEVNCQLCTHDVPVCAVPAFQAYLRGIVPGHLSSVARKGSALPSQSVSPGGRHDCHKKLNFASPSKDKQNKHNKQYILYHNAGNS